MFLGEGVETSSGTISVIKRRFVMEFLERVKTMTREQVANAMLEIITHVSPETFMALSVMSSYLVQGDQANAAVEAVKEVLVKAKMAKRVDFSSG